MKKFVIFFLLGIVIQIIPIRGIYNIGLIMIIGYSVGSLPIINSFKDVMYSYIATMSGGITAESILFIIIGSIDSGFVLGRSNTEVMLYDISIYFAMIIVSYTIFYILACYLGYTSSFKAQDASERKQKKDIEELSRKK